MMCPPCSNAADASTRLRQHNPGPPIPHDPEVCRDHGIQPHGCPCQHGQNPVLATAAPPGELVLAPA